MLVTRQCIAALTQSPSWFLGSLLYYTREPDVEVRCKSRLEPELTSEVNTWIDMKRTGSRTVPFTVIVNTIKPKTKRECSGTSLKRECLLCLLDGDTRKRQSLIPKP